MRRISVALVACLSLLGACSDAAPEETATRPPADEAVTAQPAAVEEGSSRKEPPPAPRKVDPKRDGFEITLGEWAITPEAPSVRPGRIEFVIHNRGTVPHGFEIELEGESSGHGSGDLFKAESRLLQPGESARMVLDLPPAVYKIECLVDGHDDMGMEGPLEVSQDAPLVASEPKAAPDEISITRFEFAPASVAIEAGTEVTWTNDDPTDHTVTSLDGDFGSDSLGNGDTFSHRFTEPGTYAYRCAIHPEMTGKVKVE